MNFLENSASITCTLSLKKSHEISNLKWIVLSCSHALEVEN